MNMAGLPSFAFPQAPPQSASIRSRSRSSHTPTSSAPSSPQSRPVGHSKSGSFGVMISPGASTPSVGISYAGMGGAAGGAISPGLTGQVGGSSTPPLTIRTGVSRGGSGASTPLGNVQENPMEEDELGFSPENLLLPALHEEKNKLSSTTANQPSKPTSHQQFSAEPEPISRPPSRPPPSSSRPGPTPQPSVKPLSSADIRALQESGAHHHHHPSHPHTPSKTGTSTPLTGGDHNKAKYEAYRALLETGGASVGTNGLVLGPAKGEGTVEGEEEEGDVGRLRRALRAVLHDAEELSRQNLSLRTNQSDLETKLKITMSNLQLAEMNSELLEEALKRGGEGYVGRMGPVVDHAQYSQGTMGKTGPSSTTIGFPDKQKPVAPTPVRHSLDTAGRYGGAAMSSPFGMGGMRGASISMAIASGGNTPTSSRPGSRAPSRQGTDGVGQEKVPARPMSAHPAGSSERPTMTRRKSSDNALGKSPPSAAQAGNQKPAPGLGRSNTTRAVSGAVPTPRRPIATRPGMERSATMGPGSIPNDLSFSESLGSVGSSLGGFFRKNLEKNGPAAGLMRELGLNQLRMPDLRDLPLAMPSPGNMTPRSEFLANSPPTTTGSLGQGGNTPRTIPTMASMLEGGSSAANAAELQKMRATLAQSQTTLKALTNELDTLKKAKSDLESELESLSQALFEEANKMVAEERKKHAKVIEDVRRELRDVKEELDEVRKEREAVKSTMRLLEGERSATPVSESTEKKDAFLNDRPLDGPAKVQAESDVKNEPAVKAFAPEPRVASAEEVEQLMKRMEEDFGKL